MISNILNENKFKIGDVVRIHYFLRTKIYFFKGIIFSQQNKLLKQNILGLRNICLNIAIELKIPLFFSNIIFLDNLVEERKKIRFKKAKLLFLRVKVNRYSFYN